MDDYEKRAQDYYDRKVARAEGVWSILVICWVVAILMLITLVGLA